jgi:hypothetical protein
MHPSMARHSLHCIEKEEGPPLGVVGRRIKYVRESGVKGPARERMEVGFMEAEERSSVG